MKISLSFHLALSLVFPLFSTHTEGKHFGECTFGSSCGVTPSLRRQRYNPLLFFALHSVFPRVFAVRSSVMLVIVSLNPKNCVAAAKNSFQVFEHVFLHIRLCGVDPCFPVLIFLAIAGWGFWRVKEVIVCPTTGYPRILWVPRPGV